MMQGTRLELLKRLARAATRPARASRHTTRWLFGADPVSRIHDDLWDLTTLVLKKALRDELSDGDRVLELGTGHVGVLAIYAAKRRRVEMVAVDVSEQFLKNAEQVARASGAPAISFLASNWFSAVRGRFDLVFCNLPYVPTAAGRAFGATEEHSQIWDGGSDGCDTARAVLADAATHLTGRGRLLLGVNRIYVPRETLTAVIADYPFSLKRVVTSRVSPGEVYVLEGTSKP